MLQQLSLKWMLIDIDDVSLSIALVSRDDPGLTIYSELLRSQKAKAFWGSPPFQSSKDFPVFITQFIFCFSYISTCCCKHDLSCIFLRELLINIIPCDKMAPMLFITFKKAKLVQKPFWPSAVMLWTVIWSAVLIRYYLDTEWIFPSTLLSWICHRKKNI